VTTLADRRPTTKLACTRWPQLIKGTGTVQYYNAAN